MTGSSWGVYCTKTHDQHTSEQVLYECCPRHHHGKATSMALPEQTRSLKPPASLSRYMKELTTDSHQQAPAGAPASNRWGGVGAFLSESFPPAPAGHRGAGFHPPTPVPVRCCPFPVSLSRHLSPLLSIVWHPSRPRCQQRGSPTACSIKWIVFWGC